jgi:hypothetical protein
MMDTALTCFGLIAASVLVSALLACMWARNRGWFGYVNSTAAVWIGLSMLPPVDYPHFLASLTTLTPFAILPLLFLGPLVAKGGPARAIFIASTVTSIFALPLSGISVLYTSCYFLHEGCDL